MTTIVYNRPAAVESVYSDVVEVRFVDNGLLSYVDREEVVGRDPDEYSAGSDGEAEELTNET